MRFDWSVPADAQVDVELGANDALRGCCRARRGAILDAIVARATAQL